MNSFKLNTFQKFACFALVIILVICAVGFAADGWQINLNNTQNRNEQENKDESNNQNNENSDENKGQENNSPPQSDTEQPEEPLYFSAATGMQISKSESEAIPIGIVVDPNAPIYGISSSDISIEFPVEDGTTRLLAYTTDDDIMWKIGSLKPTRNYISNMSNFFGGIVVSYGKDDIINYESWNTEDLELDLSAHQDNYYIENTSYVYTTEAMIESAKEKSPSGLYAGYSSMPFSFANSQSTLGYNEATAITIPYSTTNESQFYYNELTGKYLYYKSGNRKLDMLTGKNLDFTNLFILFANATTYENSAGSQMVIDTVSGGKGYYISDGKLTEFNWTTSKNGALEFKNLMGETLEINRGNSYISFYKASNFSKITFS